MIPSKAERAQLADSIAAGARAVHFSNATVKWFLGSATPGQMRAALTPALGKSVYAMNGDGPKDYEMAFSFDADGHAVIEFKYVPSMIELKSAGQVLVDFQYNDSVEAATRDYCLGWSDESDNASNDAGIWGYVTLGKAGDAASKRLGEHAVMARDIIEGIR